MARLNEPPVMADSLDALRRRFLRQNRDIARVNSNQSLRIRGLENECARLLSENLELRSQVMRLEKEVQDNSAQRIADHALQLKAKLEAQLIELGSLVAGFGLEPPAKKQSPTAAAASSTGKRARKPPRFSLSSETSSPERRNTIEISPIEAEALAEQEGRLPPIFEEKTYPRQTLNQDEILALQTDAAESESPILDSPSIPRVYYDEPTPLDSSPTKTVEAVPEPPVLKARSGGRTSPEATTAMAAEDDKPSAASEKRPLSTKDTNTKQTDTSRTRTQHTAPIVMPEEPSTGPILRTGAKRKFAVNDENAVAMAMKAEKVKSSRKASSDDNHPVRELKNPRSIRDLANRSKDGKNAARKPLGVKSTNEDVGSPRKRMTDDAGKPKNSGNNSKSDSSSNNINNNPGSGKGTGAGGRTRDRTKTPIVVHANPEPPKVVDIHVEEHEETPSAKPAETVEPMHDENVLSTDSPSTPSRTTTPIAHERSTGGRAEGRDTPPPADISSQGETSRPSRRARASVSYAEPNLRDKMRRPTKELVDAVAGEGKYHQRQQQEDHASLHVGIEKLSLQSPSPDVGDNHMEALVSKPKDLVLPERRKRASTSPRESEDPAKSKAPTKSQGQPEPDPYEFTLSSPPKDRETVGGTTATTAVEQKSRRRSNANANAQTNGGGSSRGGRTTRRSSSVATSKDIVSTVGGSVADQHTKPSAARKRASMAAAPKRSSRMLGDEDGDDKDNKDNDEDPADSSYELPSSSRSGSPSEPATNEGHAMSTRDRISRRRSMML